MWILLEISSLYFLLVAETILPIRKISCQLQLFHSKVCNIWLLFSPYKILSKKKPTQLCNTIRTHHTELIDRRIFSNINNLRWDYLWVCPQPRRIPVVASTTTTTIITSYSYYYILLLYFFPWCDNLWPCCVSKSEQGICRKKKLE